MSTFYLLLYSTYYVLLTYLLTYFYQDASGSASPERQVGLGARVRRILGPAGTAILFEISSVHRGTPCGVGRDRLSLTTYYHNPLPGCRAA